MTRSPRSRRSSANLDGRAERHRGRRKTEGPAATEDPRDFVTLKPQYVPDYTTPRFRLTPEHFAYVKIAEGCNHTCTFCIIPQIRGRHRSRTQESVVKEVEALVKSGVKEINLISQDTTYFGMDKWTESRPNPKSPVDSSRANRWPRCCARSTRSRASSGSACSTPTRPIGPMNSSRPSPSATRSRSTWTFRSSTSRTTCSS
ncbi:MAG: radical SAM protein [Luteolibacter sp.]